MEGKCAVVKHTFGGAKGGSDLRPHSFRTESWKRITRTLYGELIELVGRTAIVPRSDLGQ